MSPRCERTPSAQYVPAPRATMAPLRVSAPRPCTPANPPRAPRQGNEFFTEVAEDFVQDDFNLTGLGSQVQRPSMRGARPLPSPYPCKTRWRPARARSVAGLRRLGDARAGPVLRLRAGHHPGRGDAAGRAADGGAAGAGRVGRGGALRAHTRPLHQHGARDEPDGDAPRPARPRRPAPVRAAAVQGCCGSGAGCCAPLRASVLRLRAAKPAVKRSCLPLSPRRSTNSSTASSGAARASYARVRRCFRWGGPTCRTRSPARPCGSAAYTGPRVLRSSGLAQRPRGPPAGHSEVLLPALQRHLRAQVVAQGGARARRRAPSRASAAAGRAPVTREPRARAGCDRRRVLWDVVSAPRDAGACPPRPPRQEATRSGQSSLCDRRSEKIGAPPARACVRRDVTGFVRATGAPRAGPRAGKGGVRAANLRIPRAEGRAARELGQGERGQLRVGG